MASKESLWNDDEAFFIQRESKDSAPLQAIKPEAIKRDPSFVGIVEDIHTVALDEPDHAAFYLDSCKHELCSSHQKHEICLRILRESSAVPDNLRDDICSTLQERSIGSDDLLNKSEEEVDFLFPDATALKAVKAWRQLELWRRDQLPTEALRLTNAVKVGNLDVVKEICQKPNIPPLGRQFLIEHRDESSHCRTPLMHAARHGHLPIVGYLVKVQNANIHARDSHKLQSMAIHFAAQGGFVEIVRFLAGIDPELVEVKNKYSDTPLNMAAVGGKLSVVECLVSEKKANIENRGQYGMTPLLCAAEKGHLNVVKFLVEKGANIAVKDDKHADMAIHWAARFGHTEVVNYLSEIKGTCLEAPNGLGRTPLHQASLGGHLPVVKLLVKKGANLAAMSNDDDLVSSAIHLAAYFGHTSVVAFLLDNKPDLLEVQNKDEKTAYMLAKEEKQVDLMRLLEQRGAKTNRRF